MMRFSKLSVGAAVVVAGVSLAGSAMAQDAEASGEVGMTLPGAVPGQKAAAAEGESDHDQMIGRFAVGYLGARTVPILDPVVGANGEPPIAYVQAPVIGLRYWLDQTMGLDVGVGFHSDSGSFKVGNTSTDRAGTNAALIHAGVPFALAGAGHFSFQIVPELNVGFSSQTRKDEIVQNDELKLSGFVVDVGARAGAEIHFGFIGVPQLSLQGSIGVYFRQEKGSADYTAPNAGTVSFENTSTLITTGVYDNPWNIFTGNVAALYYF